MVSDPPTAVRYSQPQVGYPLTAIGHTLQSHPFNWQSPSNRLQLPRTVVCMQRQREVFPLSLGTALHNPSSLSLSLSLSVCVCVCVCVCVRARARTSTEKVFTDGRTRGSHWPCDSFGSTMGPRRVKRWRGGPSYPAPCLRCCTSSPSHGGCATPGGGAAAPARGAPGRPGRRPRTVRPGAAHVHWPVSRQRPPACSDSRVWRGPWAVQSLFAPA